MVPFQTSVETANRIYSFGWWASVAGASVTLVGVALLWWSTRVRDKDFESRMSSANTTAARANERAAKLELEAAQARLELERIRAGVSARKVGDKKEILTAAFAAMARKVPSMRVEWVADRETDGFAKEILSALHHAGVKVTTDRIGMMAPPVYGIIVYDTPDHDIASAFATAGVETTGGPAHEAGPTILIGHKPPTL